MEHSIASGFGLSSGRGRPGGVEALPDEPVVPGVGDVAVVLVALGAQQVNDRLVLLLVQAIRLDDQHVKGHQGEVYRTQDAQLPTLHVQGEEVDVLDAKGAQDGGQGLAPHRGQGAEVGAAWDLGVPQQQEF
jgi:hypothetical protein